MNSEEKENIYNLFLIFLDSYNYDIDRSKKIKDELFKTDENFWAEKYCELIIEDNMIGNDKWISALESISSWNIIYESDDIIYVNGKKFTWHNDLCSKCSFFKLDNFNCDPLPCRGGAYYPYLVKQENLEVEETGRKYDSDKLKYHLIPPIVDEELANILTFGAKKYGENNWQGLDDFNNRYYSALRRHLEAWRNGEDLDPESGNHHLSHVLTNVAFLVWKNVNKK